MVDYNRRLQLWKSIDRGKRSIKIKPWWLVLCIATVADITIRIGFDRPGNLRITRLCCPPHTSLLGHSAETFDANATFTVLMQFNGKTKTVSYPGGSAPPPNTWFPPESSTQIESAIFLQLTIDSACVLKWGGTCRLKTAPSPTALAPRLEPIQNSISNS